MNELKPSTLVDAEDVIERLEDQLAKSESATARARYAYDRLSEQMEQNIERAQSSLKAKNDALEAQLAEAKKDSARLDYLETRDIVAAGGTFGKTVRTTIDDVMPEQLMVAEKTCSRSNDNRNLGMGTSVEGTQMSNTPRTDAATVRMERLDGDIDEVVSADFARTIERELIAARSATGEPVAWMYEEHGERMFGHPDGYRPLGAVPLYAGSPPVTQGDNDG